MADHQTNADIRVLMYIKEETVMDTITKSKLQRFDHVCRIIRMPEDRLLQTLMVGMVEASWQPGRPHGGGLENFYHSILPHVL